MCRIKIGFLAPRAIACRQATRGGLGALLKIENAHEETTHFSPDIAFLDQPFFISYADLCTFPNLAGLRRLNRFGTTS